MEMAARGKDYVLRSLVIYANTRNLNIIDISGSHGGGYEDESSRMLHRIVSQKLTELSEVLSASYREYSE
jgi:hypothetical protein